MNPVKKIIVIGLSALLTFGFTACTAEAEAPADDEQENKNPVVSMTLSNDMVITCELYPEIAPITVENFLSLVKSGFYEGTIFHRVIENFMIQGGGYFIENNTIFEKGGATPIKGEFSSNGVPNDLKHEAGVLSMARTAIPDSATSQFFICSAEASWLDGDYAAFGKVIDETSLKNVIALSQAATYTLGYLQNFPIEPISIRSIEVVE